MSVRRALKARLISDITSVPHIAFVEGQIMFPQNLSKFLLERAGPVMLVLVLDVTHHLRELAGADRKRAVTALPMEMGIAAAQGLDPGGRTRLCLLYSLGLGNGA
jgi:hypothetical protein